MRITVRGVKQTTVSGRTYFYHRATGERIHDAPESAAFLATVERLDARAPLPPVPGTVGAMLKAFQGSPEFRIRAERTKADYRWVIGRLAWLDAVPVAEVTSAIVNRTRDKAYDAHGWRFANYVIDVLRAAFKWAKPNGYAQTNPANEVPRLPRPSGLRRMNRAWRPEEVAAVLNVARGGMRVAIALAIYAGMRQGDAIRLKWSARQDGGIVWVQHKTAEPVWVPERSELRAILDAADKDGIFMVARRRRNKSAQPIRDSDYTERGFRASFFRIIRGLVAKQKVGAGLTFHGLRVTAATNLADAGCDPKTIAAITGHRTSAMVEHYTRDADRRRRATSGIATMERATNDSGKDARTALAKSKTTTG